MKSQIKVNYIVLEKTKIDKQYYKPCNKMDADRLEIGSDLRITFNPITEIEFFNFSLKLSLY